MCASAPPFSGPGSLDREHDLFGKPGPAFPDHVLGMNDNSCLARQPAHQPLQIAARKRDTAGGREKSWPRDMKKYRTAVAGDARARVMVDLDDQIVKPVGTFEAIAWFIGRPPEWTIVAAVLGVFAPGVVRRDRPDRQESAWSRQAIRPPPQPNRMKSADRRGAIAFAFRCLDACPAQSCANRALPRHEPSLRPQSRTDVHMDRRQGGLTHWVAQRLVFSSRHELSRSSQAQSFQPRPTIALSFCALTFCGHMIFSENRFPLHRIML